MPRNSKKLRAVFSIERRKTKTGMKPVPIKKLTNHSFDEFAALLRLGARMAAGLQNRERPSHAATQDFREYSVS